MNLCTLLLLQAPLLDYLPPDALAVGACDRPAETIAAIAEGEIGRRIQAGGLWTAIQSRPGFLVALLGWTAVSAPVGGKPAEFARALAGGGVAAALVRGAEAGAEPDLLVVARIGNGEVTERILEQAARLAKIPAQSVSGDAWDLPVGEVRLLRRGDLLAFASTVPLAEQFAARFAQPPPSMTRPGGIERLRARGASLWAWASGELLRADGYDPLPTELGASLLAADLHEALRVAAWAGGVLDLTNAGARAEFLIPEPADLATTHAPFRPAAREVNLPRVDGSMLRGVLLRDLGGWYNARDRYASAAAVASSVEGDGNFRVLFGRDFGPEVLAWLEPEVRVVAGFNPDATARALEVEFPAAATGFRLRTGAPADLPDGFVSAFLAAITFTNFQAGAADEKYLTLDVETLPDGGKIYAGKRRVLAAGLTAPQAFNVEPALYLGADGEIWLSSSIGLLHEILAAPAEPVRSTGSWVEFALPPAAELIGRARGAIVARRLLANGGDQQAANQFAALIEAGSRLLDGAALRLGAADGLCSVVLEVRAQPE
jgi:hypothetical protein